jgi:predicted phosphodiesterase
MRIALLADVHANLLALETVWEALKIHKPDAVWFLGDITDRGPHPVETILWLRDAIHRVPGNEWVMGNHDAMHANLLTEEQFGRVGKIHQFDNAHHRTLLQSHPEAWAFIEETFKSERLVPQQKMLDSVFAIIVHGGLVDHAGYYRYLYPWWNPPLFMWNSIVPLDSEFGRLNALEWPAFKLMVCGHTHIQTLIGGCSLGGEGAMKVQAIPVVPGQKYPLSSTQCWLINPGSVGQPRNLDNRAAYAILDIDPQASAVTFFRQEYDWRSVARQLLEAGADRLYLEVLRDATADKDTPPEWLAHYRMAKETQHE